jgi:hypothetical protein
MSLGYLLGTFNIPNLKVADVGHSEQGGGPGEQGGTPWSTVRGCEEAPLAADACAEEMSIHLLAFSWCADKIRVLVRKGAN